MVERRHLTDGTVVASYFADAVAQLAPDAEPLAD
jgi:hypothetical protein